MCDEFYNIPETDKLLVEGGIKESFLEEEAQYGPSVRELWAILLYVPASRVGAATDPLMRPRALW